MAKVMVIDDDPGIIEVVELMLSLDGYTAAHSLDSSAALDRVRQEAPDIILLDLMMPFVDGWQVLAALRRDAETWDIPVVMITARADLEQARNNPAGWGLADFVVKPFDFESLSTAIRKGLSSAGNQPVLEDSKKPWLRTSDSCGAVAADPGCPALWLGQQP